MEDDKVIMDEFPMDQIANDTMSATLTPTDEVIPAPETSELPVGTEPVCAEPVCPAGAAECPATADEANQITVPMFFGTIQECVTITWRMHLKTHKHFIHVVLNEFYDEAIDDVDDIIEQYQGFCGVVEEPFVNTIPGDGKTEVDYLRELKAFVENNKCILGNRSEINSTIDNFLGHIDSAIYKLTSFSESKVKSFEEFCYEDLSEGCKYDRFGERTCDNPDDPDYDPDYDGESCGEDCGEEEE